ncbi:uncharacterized protein KY384_000581 [Bacidia gigantensis]|uniref:uncharacterized protein n=1 Tax=Bacidia gigantensis TaxID=2732470 RepID=UPI001D0544C7|nr:uncharacterized protein KY384_000581 [Bacidia gigantensis]KAG8525821.1 hypothetical protein KY384_000581 [Bacidia gigantensis]
MDQGPKPSSTSLFQVYLRLRPPPSPLVQLTPQSIYPNLPPLERYLTVEPPSPESEDGLPTHITLNPPNETRKRAIERFAFTKVYEEQAEQIDIFKGTGVIPLVEAVLNGGRDGLVATLGVTGSGKSHTILGSKTQRGLTQLSLDLLYRSLGQRIVQPCESPSLIGSLTSSDPSEAQIYSAHAFLDSVYGDGLSSRAQTPMTWVIMGLEKRSLTPSIPKTIRVVKTSDSPSPITTHCCCINRALDLKNYQRTGEGTQAIEQFSNVLQDHLQTPCAPRRRLLQAFPQSPDIRNINLHVESQCEFVIVVSMYEVYNDRIYDLLSLPSNQKDIRRRALLFKPTETSAGRKVVAGLRKIVCGSYEEALRVLETGLVERRVAGTGSNSVSSRSHGFFCVEVKRRPRGGMANSWQTTQLTVVDLAGSERARNAKTAGATLAEAGKINESLMYLGQCLQMQSDNHDNAKPSLVPFRQCKLTELLFSNSFPSATTYSHHNYHQAQPRNPQKAVMIVTADPLGDFNATSQMLRYSALAREITVPRIPSVSSTILAGMPGSRAVSGRTSPNASTNGTSTVDETVVEMAFSELARLNEEVEILSHRFSEEQTRRMEAEAGWRHAEQRAEEVEMEVREELSAEMERKVSEESARWKDNLAEEGGRSEEHFDRKLEILAKGVKIHEDEDAQNDYATGLERENEALRGRLEQVERQLRGAESPSKRNSRKKEQPNFDSRRDVLQEASFKLNGLSLTGPPTGLMSSEGEENERKLPKTPAANTPGQKVRKLTTRKWDLMDESQLEAYEGF